MNDESAHQRIGRAISALGDAHDHENALSPSAIRYAQSHWHGVHHWERLTRLGLRGSAALDAGCGTGAWTFALADRYEHVVGLDASAERTALARHLRDEAGISHTEIGVGDIRSIPMPADTFDLVWCAGVVISYLDLDEVLAELARVLRPTGWLYLSLNGPGWHDLLTARPQVADHGRKGIYNSLVSSRLHGLPQELGSVPRETPIQSLDDVESLLPRMAPEIRAVADELAERAGPQFRELLVRDLKAFGAGDSRTFSHPRAGRSYLPAEVMPSLGRHGFGSVTWGQEGSLASWRNRSAPGTPIYPGEHQGALGVWELMARKRGLRIRPSVPLRVVNGTLDESVPLEEALGEAAWTRSRTSSAKSSADDPAPHRKAENRLDDQVDRAGEGLDDLERDWSHLAFPGDDAAARYARGMHGRPLGYYQARIRQMGLAGESALDAGSGTGTWSFAMADRFDRVLAVDKSPERSDLGRWIAARYGIDNIEFAAGDLMRLPSDATFDLIFCYGVVISYLPLQEVLAEFSSRLNPGGIIYASVNGHGWHLHLRDVRGAKDQRVRDLGVQGIYNTLCQQHLADLPQVLRSEPSPPPPDSEAVLDGVRTTFGDEIADRLERVVGVVRTECGDDLAETVLEDVRALWAGDASTFSFRNRGRAYEPDEVQSAVQAVGLSKFTWGPEGTLVAADLEAPLVAPVHAAEVAGHLKVWEFVARKPGAVNRGSGEVRASSAPDPSLASRRIGSLLIPGQQQPQPESQSSEGRRVVERSLAEWLENDRAPSPNRLHGASLRRFPFPFRAALTVSNDTDGMSLDSFLDMHAFVSGRDETPYGPGLGLEVSDSFWHWAPDRALSLRVGDPADSVPANEHQREVIAICAAAGWLDSLHGFGQWTGEPLDRARIADALEEMASLGVRPTVYTNHGGGNHMVHNVGGPWAYYHGVDDPTHPAYAMDLLREWGLEYFWNDWLYETDKFGENLQGLPAKEQAANETRRDLDRYFRVRDSYGGSDIVPVLGGLTTEQREALKARLATNLLNPLPSLDGQRSWFFKRFRGKDGPTSANFALQVSSERLDRLERHEGVVVVYTHFGVWRALGRPKAHDSWRFSRPPVLDESNVWAFRELAERQERGSLFVTTVARLLDYIRVRDNLRWHVEDREDGAAVVIDAVDCPVRGRFTPSPRQLQGLSFTFERPVSALRVRLGNEEVATSTFDEDGKAGVMIPWTRLEWPEFPT